MNVPSSFVREDRRDLFEEQQRMGAHFDLNANITKMIYDLYNKGTFADHLSALSLRAVSDESWRAKQ